MSGKEWSDSRSSLVLSHWLGTDYGKCSFKMNTAMDPKVRQMKAINQSCFLQLVLLKERFEWSTYMAAPYMHTLFYSI